MGVKIPMLNKRFGKLTVIRQSAQDNKGAYRWLCKCDCGNQLIVNGSNLRRGHSKSCGCLKLEIWTNRKQPVVKECLNCAQIFQPYCGADKYCNPCRPVVKKENHRIGQAKWRAKNPKLHQKTKADWDLRAKFGLTLIEYEEMFNQQRGVCAICRVSGNGRGMGVLRTLCVDHCHVTGKIRGLLCANCNTAIGLLRENITILKSAINYINTYGE